MRYDVRVPKEENEMVQELRYQWRKLKKTADEVAAHLTSLQNGFKKELIKNVRQFAQAGEERAARAQMPAS